LIKNAHADWVTTISRNHRTAFTLVGLLIILAVIGILAAMLLPALAKAKQRAQRIQCVNDLKQCGLADRIWAADNNDKFPMAVSNNLGGTLEWVSDGNAYRHFQIMSNELNTTKVLVCPADTRQPAVDFAHLQNQNVSYFVGLNAKPENERALLAGDRNITNGLSPVRTVLILPPNRPAGWTEMIHRGVGNVGLSDGSVQQLSTPGLQTAMKNTGETNRIALPQ
jgi:Tfp pilus assembly protein PilE